jgi:hypothetical protein
VPAGSADTRVRIHSSRHSSRQHRAYHQAFNFGVESRLNLDRKVLLRSKFSLIAIYAILHLATTFFHETSSPCRGTAGQMPFPFVLPTTSAFSFSSSFASDSHPSLPLTASTHRAVLRDVLKKHKRVPHASQAPHLPAVISAVMDYIPYLLAIDSGLGNGELHGEIVSVVLKKAPVIEWRPTLSYNAMPGKEAARVKVQSLEYEVSFVLGTLAMSHVQTARTILRPLYVTSTASVGTEQRVRALGSACGHLCDAAAIYDYLAGRAEQVSSAPPCPDIGSLTLRGLSALALAEANLLMALKDDPYPAAVAQDRNENDKDWMIQAPQIPKIRAELFGRFCLTAAQYAAKGQALCGSGGKLNGDLMKYMEDLRRTSRARACRFFGIGAESLGDMGKAIAYLDAGVQELGMERKEERKGLGFSRLKREWSERREDHRVESQGNWGSDGGKLEELRIIEMLSAKWNKINDTVSSLDACTCPVLLITSNHIQDQHSSHPADRSFDRFLTHRPVHRNDSSV